MKRVRMNVYFERQHASQIIERAILNNQSKSSIVAEAMGGFLSSEAPDKREAAILKRFDRLTRQIDALDRDQTILIEALALFIRHQLGMAAAVTEADQPIIRAHARARFGQFTTQLVQHLQRGGSLVRQLSEEMTGPNARQPQVRSTVNGAAE